jgi:hypothetical protein
MRLLLDTHVFLWYISADPQLPVAFRDAIRDPANEVYLSAASVWEAVIKHALGKLSLPEALVQRRGQRTFSLQSDRARLDNLPGGPLCRPLRTEGHGECRASSWRLVGDVATSGRHRGRSSFSGRVGA